MFFLWLIAFFLFTNDLFFYKVDYNKFLIKMQLLYLSNIIFGKDYTETFLYALPSLLVNLKYLKKKSWPAVYKIYTTQKDKEIILQSETFKKILDLIQIDFIDIGKFIKDSPHKTMIACHNHIIYNANKLNAVVVFLLSDFIFSNNIFEKICSCLTNGKRVLVGTALRLNKEDFIKSNNNSTLIDIKPRDLIKKALFHLHNMSYDFFWNDGTKIWHNTALLCWFLDKKNILIRAFHLHPIFVWPEKKEILCKGTMDSEFITYACPDKTKWEIITNSDEGILFELTRKERAYGGFYTSNHKTRIADKFVHKNLFKAHFHFAQSKIYILSTGYIKNKKWQLTEKRSDKIINFLSRKYNNFIYRSFFLPIKQFSYIFYIYYRAFRHKLSIRRRLSIAKKFLKQKFLS